ncbi:hypothetical protein [Agrobacterium tumefaciens]|nr:hypothetical protein [Agrobacterium tumefaciens]
MDGTDCGMPGKARLYRRSSGNIFIFIVWKIMMLNRGKVRNRGMSPQLVAVNCASSDDMLSDAESVDDGSRPPPRNDRLYVVSEPISRTLPPFTLEDDRAGEETPARTEIRNRVVDSDIRAAKWAWAILAIAHCWLIYFMVHNLGG